MDGLETAPVGVEIEVQKIQNVHDHINGISQCLGVFVWGLIAVQS